MKDKLLSMLNSLANGKISPEEAWKSLEGFFFEDIGFARVDHRRAHRFGFPEPVFAPGKTIEELTEIAEKLVERSSRAFLTRLASEQASAVEEHFAGQALRINRRARTCLLGEVQAERTERALVVSAGTSDAPVAEEAWETLLASGFEVPKVLDAGVAGIHRLLADKERIEAAEVVVVVAGMEGALASVVGGLASSLVIGVPTSVGYGASFGGVSALLAMLNSCSPNVVTVNIDDGFGAGFTAGLVLRRAGG